MKNLVPVFAVAAILTACTPAAQVEPAAEVAPPAETAPPAVPVARESIAETYSDCTWGEVVSAGISIWSYACANDRLVADETVPGFVRERTSETGEVVRNAAIQFFPKAPGADMGSIIDAVRAASPGAETCEIEPGSHGDFVLMPTGDAMTAYSKFLSGEAEGPSDPCGPLGPSEGGGRTFRLLEGAPDKVIMIDWPSDVPIFDPDTLSVVK